MRKALIGLFLAATAATPYVALAQDAGPDREAVRQQRMEQRQQRQEARQERQEVRQERQAVRHEPRQEVRQERREVRQEVRQERRDVREARQEARQQRREPVQVTHQGERRQEGHWRRGDRGPSATEQAWQGDRNDPRMERHRQRYERLERRNQREWRQDRREDRREAREDRRERRWDRHQWRRDRRYDWASYRNQYRHLYRPGRYYDPFGSGYRRFGIGIHIGAPFYSSRYMIHDPWRYRLPHAGPGYAWVRYYNDVLLVDTWSGEVVDVIYDFFW